MDDPATVGDPVEVFDDVLNLGQVGELVVGAVIGNFSLRLHEVARVSPS